MTKKEEFKTLLTKTREFVKNQGITESDVEEAIQESREKN